MARNRCDGGRGVGGNVKSRIVIGKFVLSDGVGVRVVISCMWLRFIL